MQLFRILLFLILGLFPLGQLTRLPLGVPEINIYLHDLIIIILVLGWFFFHIFLKKPFPRLSLTVPILAFFLVAAFSLFVNSPRLKATEAIVASLYLLRWIFYAGIYFVVADLKLNLKWGLVAAGVAASFLAILQYVIYPDLRNLAYLGWDPHRYRIFGTFFDPGFLGIILVLTLILIVSLLWGRDQHINRLTRVGVGVAGVITYLALALTYSRSSYLAYLVGIGVLAWFKKAPKFFLMALLFGVLTTLLLPRPPGSEGVRLEREETIEARIKNWQQSLIITRDRPVFGVGFNTYRYAQKTYGFLEEQSWQETHAGAGADSSILFVLVTTGIIGLLFYLWLWVRILKVKDTAILASSLALLAHSPFLNSLFYPWVMIWFFILLGSIGHFSLNNRLISGNVGGHNFD